MWMLVGLGVGLVMTLFHKNRESGLYAAGLSAGCIGGLFGGIAATATPYFSMSDFTWLSLLPAAAGAAILFGAYLFAKRERRY
jgi:uncharacterized membrane protein YeaQ/YmgE (transglycosylase-associated protein family)